MCGAEGISHSCLLDDVHSTADCDGCECRCVEQREFLIPVYLTTYIPLLTVMVVNVDVWSGGNFSFPDVHSAADCDECECRCVERREFLIPVYLTTYIPLLTVMVACPLIYASATQLGLLTVVEVVVVKLVVF